MINEELAANQNSINHQSNNRWWEFYAVRYAMGTVIGAVIFYLLCKTNPALTPLLFESTAKGNATLPDLTISRLILLGIYGLTYCYIASAPILVFHTARIFIQPGFGLNFKVNDASATICSKVWELVKAKRPAFAIIALSIGAGLFAFYNTQTGNEYNKTSNGLMGFLMVWMTLTQFKLAVSAILGYKKVFAYYQTLSKKRSRESTDIVESYRHLREHGNSFGIVFLEIYLGVIMFQYGNIPVIISNNTQDLSVRSISGYLLIIFVWIMPATITWLTATMLEREYSGFADDN